MSFPITQRTNVSRDAIPTNGSSTSRPSAFPSMFATRRRTTSRARQDFNDLPPNVIANRAKLRDVMTRHGFEPLPSEWWHFDYAGWQRFELMNVDLRDLANGTAWSTGFSRSTSPQWSTGFSR